MSLWEFVYYKKEIVGKVVRDGKVFFKHRKTRRFPSRWTKAAAWLLLALACISILKLVFSRLAAVEAPPPDVVVEDQSGP